MSEETTGAKPAITTETAQALAIALVELDSAKAGLINSELEAAGELGFAYMAVREKSSGAFEAAQREYDLFRAENPDFDPAGESTTDTGESPAPEPSEPPAPEASPPPSDGWQGTEPAEGTRRYAILKTVKGFVMDEALDADTNALALADAIEETLLSIESQVDQPAQD